MLILVKVRIVLPYVRIMNMIINTLTLGKLIGAGFATRSVVATGLGSGKFFPGSCVFYRSLKTDRTPTPIDIESRASVYKDMATAQFYAFKLKGLQDHLHPIDKALLNEKLIKQIAEYVGPVSADEMTSHCRSFSVFVRLLAEDIKKIKRAAQWGLRPVFKTITPLNITVDQSIVLALIVCVAQLNYKKKSTKQVVLMAIAAS